MEGLLERSFGRYHSDHLCHLSPDWTARKNPIAIISGRGKATNFKFWMHIHMIDRNKSPLTMSGKVAVGVVRDSGHPYRAHRAVIFAIAQLSCSHLWLE